MHSIRERPHDSTVAWEKSLNHPFAVWGDDLSMTTEIA
jgi:hypothetical protein